MSSCADDLHKLDANSKLGGDTQGNGAQPPVWPPGFMCWMGTEAPQNRGVGAVRSPVRKELHHMSMHRWVAGIKGGQTWPDRGAWICLGDWAEAGGGEARGRSHVCSMMASLNA